MNVELLIFIILGIASLMYLSYSIGKYEGKMFYNQMFCKFLLVYKEDLLPKYKRFLEEVNKDETVVKRIKKGE